MKIISFHTLHDANVSISIDGTLVVVVELERLFDQRYFCSNPRKTVFLKQWKEAINHVTEFAKLEDFDVGITSWVMPSEVEILKTLVKAKEWKVVDHHLAHAALGFYDSPFESALIFSYDGGGNDGTFNVYSGHKSNGIKHIEWVGLNLGTPYRQLASAMPAITGVPKENNQELTNYMRFSPLAFAGKVMGYSAHGTVKEEWKENVKEYYKKFINPLQAMYTLGVSLGISLESNALGEENSLLLAATSQEVFEELLCEQIEIFLQKHNRDDINGIVLTGGCALLYSHLMCIGHPTSYQTLIDLHKQSEKEKKILSAGSSLNVCANQLVFDRYGLDVHVPCAPNDCGIAVGASWIVEPPKAEDQHQSIQYKGLPLLDRNYLPSLQQLHGAMPITATEIAKLLVIKGAIVAVVRGRQEFGPRALGHRSLLCHPDRPEMKDTMNKLKSREWYRPLCPSVTVEGAKKLFSCNRKVCTCNQKNHNKETSCDLPSSPFMSFACKAKPLTRKKFPAICHVDGTARLQTVDFDDENWYYTLLCEVGKLNGGFELLMNTSLNVKGKPIVNRAKTAIDILRNSPHELFQYLVIDDWLFTTDMISKQTM